MTALAFIAQEEKQQFSDEDFPLALGLTRSGAVIAGAKAEPVAKLWILTHQGRYSIQGEAARERVLYNGIALTQPVWLENGAEIILGGRTIDVAVNDQEVSLTVRESSGEEAGQWIEPQPAPAVPLQAESFGRKLAVAGRGRDDKSGFGLAKKLVLAIFALLSVGVVYVVVSSPVLVSVSPGPVDVSLVGFPPPIRIAGRYLAIPGDYTIEARKPGYKALSRPISVDFGASPSFQFALEKLPGRLSVGTPPISGARILVDGREVGQSPIEDIEVPAGNREIQVISDRYLPETRKMEIAGMGERQALEVSLKPAWGTLAVDSVPDKARVTMNGIDVGETPLRFEPLHGAYRVEIAKDGWKPVTRNVEIQIGAVVTLPTIQLEKIDGSLDIKSNPSGATIMADEKFVGQTPMTFPLVSERDFTLKLTKQGYAEAVRKVRVSGGKTTSMTIGLQPEYGTVFLTTSPAGATLKVNGRPAGSGTQRLRLQTLPQSLEIEKAGYESHKTVVLPRAGIVKKIDVRLQTLGDALKEKAKKGIATLTGQRLRAIYIGTPAKFTIGSPRREPGRRSNEAEYAVVLSRSFLISEKEVTNGEFRKFRPSHKSGEFQGMSLDGDDQPAVNVAWEDAARYANWLSKSEKLPPAYKDEGGKIVAIVPPTNGYRLPTEAEWEFVSRYDGGHEPLDKPLRFSWGDNMPPPDNSGNYADDGPRRLSFAIPKYADGFPVTAPVGKFSANRSMLYDLGGNVAEWCHDYYDVQPETTTQPLHDPTGPRQGRFHVIKGASWRSGSVTELRLSYRDYAEKPRDDLGFRIVRYVAQDAKK